MTAFSTWLSKLSYGYIVGGIAVLMLGFYFLFNAIPKTKPVKAQLLCVVGMDLITLLFYILTFSLRVSKMAAASGATTKDYFNIQTGDSTTVNKYGLQRTAELDPHS